MPAYAADIIFAADCACVVAVSDGTLTSSAYSADIAYRIHTSFFNADLNDFSFIIAEKPHIIVTGVILIYNEIRYDMSVAAEFACEMRGVIADRCQLCAAKVDIIAEDIVLRPFFVALADSLELLRRGDKGVNVHVRLIICAEVVLR